MAVFRENDLDTSSFISMHYVVHLNVPRDELFCIRDRTLLVQCLNSNETCRHVIQTNVLRDAYEIDSQNQDRYPEGGKNIRVCRGLLGRVVCPTMTYCSLLLPTLFSSRIFTLFSLVILLITDNTFLVNHEIK